MMSTPQRNPARLWTGAATIAGILALWIVAGRGGCFGGSFFPTASDVWYAGQQSVAIGCAGGLLWAHLLTFMRQVGSLRPNEAVPDVKSFITDKYLRTIEAAPLLKAFAAWIV